MGVFAGVFWGSGSGWVVTYVAQTLTLVPRAARVRTEFEVGSRSPATRSAQGDVGGEERLLKQKKL